MITLAESLAIAVLKGDTAAAYALADQLLEERARGGAPLDLAYREHNSGFPDGYDVYRWPEFKALAKRLGILWDLLTVDMTINIPCGARVTVTQKYAGCDNGRAGDAETDGGARDSTS